MNNSPIREKTFKFSLNIIKIYKDLIKDNEYILSKQLLRSATSIGANVVEAQNGSSKRDFVAKLNISLKEATETEYWMLLLDNSGYKTINEDLFNDLQEIIKILTSIIKTTRKNLRN